MRVITIGRNSNNNVVISDDKTVSRNHCQLIEENGRYRLADFGSANGTFVNGKQIPLNSEVNLNPGDIIKIGNTVLPWMNYFTAPIPTPQSQPTVAAQPPVVGYMPPQPPIGGGHVYADPPPYEKQRHGFVTFWLWLMLIGGVLGSIPYFTNSLELAAVLSVAAGKIVQPSMIYLLGVVGLLNIGLAIALLQWKKWGFWGFCGTATIAFIINASIGLLSISPAMPIIGILSILILWAILQIKKDGVSCWDNLE
jgi:hypothetical protein